MQNTFGKASREWIRIRGARQNNLQNLDVDIPKQALVVVTGVSGSGKSTLLFDVLHAETQRRYFNTFLPSSSMALVPTFRWEKPEVDSIEGLSPTIALEQGRFPVQPRSTVGTFTDIYDLLRLLFTRLGTPTCPSCRLPIRSYTIGQMAEQLFQSPEGSRVMILAPLEPVAEKKLSGFLTSLKRDGFLRVRWENQVYSLDPLPALPRRPQYFLELVVDRLSLKPDALGRLSGSLELAARHGQGSVKVVQETGESLTFSQIPVCTQCGYRAEAPSMALFSFFHPKGMCPRCEGTGKEPNPKATKSSKQEEEEQTWVEGIPCTACEGLRLNKQALSIIVGEQSIAAVNAMTLTKLSAWLMQLDFHSHEKEILTRIRREILPRLTALQNLGLGYLTLDRSMASLSSGETQRLRLAQQLAAPFSGTVYIFDEPSVGLHPQDRHRLREVLRDLRHHGNTVLVVEHDLDTLREADYVLELGPGAGPAGGRLVFAGTPDELIQCPHSTTAPYLHRTFGAEHPRSLSKKRFSHFLEIHGAQGHNLKNIHARFPLRALTCVTGVSGSGKSSLVIQTLYPALLRVLRKTDVPSLPYEKITGWEALYHVHVMDQSPVGRLPKSIPATYCGVFDPLRALFAGLPEAKARGYSAERFSFNNPGGRCEFCRGDGRLRVEMLFLPDFYVTCPYCEGARYEPNTLSVRFKGLSMADVLRLTVSEALNVFRHLPAISRKLSVLEEVGLGYLQLGQPSYTLSGGESQRLKLARALARSTAKPSLYLLDEPTTGLHPQDVERLVNLLHRLVSKGHTVIVIEHDLQFVRSADYLVDLGPGAGPDGGWIVAEGALEEVLTRFDTPTMAALRASPF